MAIASFPDSRIHFFDNPFSATKQGRTKGVPEQIGLSLGQTTSGIEIEWEVPDSVAGDIEGWIVERRRDPADHDRPFEKWIRLTPLSVPAPIRTWTDTTAQEGCGYFYRVRPIGVGAALTSPGTMGPVSTNRSF